MSWQPKKTAWLWVCPERIISIYGFMHIIHCQANKQKRMIMSPRKTKMSIFIPTWTIRHVRCIVDAACSTMDKRMWYKIIGVPSLSVGCIIFNQILNVKEKVLGFANFYDVQLASWTLSDLQQKAELWHRRNLIPFKDYRRKHEISVDCGE